MSIAYEPVIGVEVHAELETESKMFCGCQVLDSVQARPNVAVCPVCAGMPGVLPVLNRRAVEYGLRVALALDCEIPLTSIFARKNYFYPDLPKGYQISQYEEPLARNGRLTLTTSQGQKVVRIRRVHLEEDTGKLMHVPGNEEGAPAYTLIDLNRAGVPLLEIVTEPDLHSAEEVKAYAVALRALLRYVGVNSGDMQKGILRLEPNISIRPIGSSTLGTRTEIKNLNSFRALERAVAFEIERQSEVLDHGGRVVQETRGWDEAQGVTVSQRSKEEAHDYRYFPEPDLPPLVLETAFVAAVRAALPELPAIKEARFQAQYGLSAYDAGVLVQEPAVAQYFEAVVQSDPALAPKAVVNWLTGDLFALLNEHGESVEQGRISPQALAELIKLVQAGAINQTTAKGVLAKMYTHGQTAQEIVREDGLGQISDVDAIAALVHQVLASNPEPVQTYLDGKEGVERWLFGQVMRAAQSKANPQVIQQELRRQLQAFQEK